MKKLIALMLLFASLGGCAVYVPGRAYVAPGPFYPHYYRY
jgi:hypothetical protein